ncbi:MAG: glycoside hydrolase family 3 C-terminal domain-containing protein [Prevotella sp.]|nr:glycoside hydrolase family 3 C-terminal domain-containing protein [Prevotella sp.]
MNKLILLALMLCCLTTSVQAAKKNVTQKQKEVEWPYKNPQLPVNERVNDLLSRMTLEEKVGQTLCLLGWDSWTIQEQAKKGKKTERQVTVSEKFKKEIDEQKVGAYWGVYRADPWTRKTLANGLTPELAAKAGNAIQRYALEQTRLGIPVFLAEEAPHGHMAIGTTVFPTGLGMSSTFNTNLIEEVGRAIGKEIRLQGGHISYGPVLDLVHDPRWSRVEETFGEDPVLTGAIGAAMVRGLGGGDLSKPYSTLPTLKHFLAYGATEGGQNGNPTNMGLRDLTEQFLPPFREAVNAGALSIMTSYNSMDGIPCTANTHLLTDVLKKQWGFRGFVVSDLYSIDGMWETHHVAETLQDAAMLAANAGVEMDLGGKAFLTLIDAVKNGKLKMEVLDAAVRQILTMKFEMGLFDHPYTDPKTAVAEVHNADHVALARKVAQESITLLQNKRNILPLAKNLRVAVVGPNADNRYNLLGDYTAPQPDENVKTVLDGIRSKLPSEHVTYVKGCAVRDTQDADIEAAVRVARESDVVVAVVGGSSARDFKTEYKETGAAITDSKTISDMECGEGFDRATLSLLGLQQQLLESLRQTGKPLIVIYIEGRPMEKNWATANADALLTAYYPGQEGGLAIADVLFGDYNPAGRLSVSIPRSVGQLPVYYNKKNPVGHDYVEEPVTPLYAFGYGLSYTTFRYDALSVTKKGETEFEVSFNVTNSGSRDGDEVPQLYLRDEVASVVQPNCQLKHFCRLHLLAGETKRVTFTITSSDLELVNARLQRVVEPGTFTVMVGAASNDIRLKSSFTVNKQ